MLPEPSGDWLIPTVGLGTTSAGRVKSKRSSMLAQCQVPLVVAGDNTLVVNSYDPESTAGALTFL